MRAFACAALLAVAVAAAHNPRELRGRSPNPRFARAVPALSAPLASDPWNSTGIKGVQYDPSYAMNSIMTW